MVPRRTPPEAQHGTPGAQRGLEDMLRREFHWFLKAYFGDDDTVIAYHLGVSAETARLWRTTERLPRAELLYRMLLGYPAFAARLNLVVCNPDPPSRPRHLSGARETVPGAPHMAFRSAA